MKFFTEVLHRNQQPTSDVLGTHCDPIVAGVGYAFNRKPDRLTLDRILVATDFAKPSDLALAYAKALAKRFSSKLTVTHVVDLSVAARSASAPVGFQIDDMRRSRKHGAYTC